VYVCSGHKREKVSVVCVWGTATVWVLKPVSVTRYEKLPELSVDVFQASETLVSVVAAIRRFVGVVGACLSPGAGGRLAPAAGTTTNARKRASAAPDARRATGFFAVMWSLLLTARYGGWRVHS